MSNNSQQTTVWTNVRVLGSKNAAGEQFGGIYYPAHTKNGDLVRGRWESLVAANKRPYTDKNGNKKESKPVIMRLVVWNGKNAAEGEGLADTFAKCVSVGKSLSCNVRISSFDKRMFVDGQPLTDSKGNAVTYLGYNFIFEGNLDFGVDSQKVLAREIENYKGNATFDSRPEFWKKKGHADKKAWDDNISPARMKYKWNGQTEQYGYARIIPECIKTANAAQSILPQQTIQDQTAAAETVANTVIDQTPVIPPTPSTGQTPTQAAQTLTENQCLPNMPAAAEVLVANVTDSPL